MNPVLRLHELGQSLWLDYIRRDLMDSGELARLVAAGEVRGVTSNPSIFAKAISDSDLYTSDLRMMAQAGWKEAEAFDALAVDDIRAATAVLLPLYEQTNGGDGYVSLEVNPELANNTRETVREARRLWDIVNRPNVMIKIPATQAGIPAIEETIAAGINVNVTLIFSLERYADVMEAYLRGLESRLRNGDSLDHVASVASFFVSRIDTAVDSLLAEIIRREDSQAERAAALLGRAAISSAKLAYAQFKVTFGGSRFQHLADHGARPQRPLWASTSTKNPEYPDTYYVDHLIGPNTVNTLPLHTIEAFRDHGTAEPALERDLAVSRAQIEALSALDISMESVTDQLELEGVGSFAEAYKSLLKILKRRARGLQRELGVLTTDVLKVIREIEETNVGARLWGSDTTLWAQQPSETLEIAQRLGWLSLPQEMPSLYEDLSAFVTEVKDAGLTKVVWLGMGGSSLAADVFRRTFESQSGLEFQILDSTNPTAVSAVTRKEPLEETLFVVASKSGGTIEPIMFMKYFWDRVAQNPDIKPGEHFAAVTDRGTKLEALAQERGFRRIFTSPEDVGGRYAALSIFGLLPASLMGVSVEALHEGAMRMASACEPGNTPARNPGLHLGAIIGAAARSGRDKLTLIADPVLESFSDWIEQLIAESSGKGGEGILPIVREPPGPARVYGEDRLLVYLRSGGTYDRRARGWARAKIPLVILDMEVSPSSVGGAFFQWEVATAVACHLIGVNAFNQPDVQLAKDRAVDMLKVYRKRGTLPEPPIIWRGDGVTVWGTGSEQLERKIGSLEDLFAYLLSVRASFSHVTFLLYLPQDKASLKRLARVRRSILNRLNVATNVGFGPRYLHSTGQIHKGGPNSGLYLIVTAEPKVDVEVPEEGITFGVLERAQAIGDLQTLISLRRSAYGLHLDSPRRFRDLMSATLTAVEML
ncbi:MAG: bifunctional transaldolase/phosoglucose isomerase [Anaerolineales bacterium]|nr:bifunctional transaldolase/phosoglucose isomerase [Anaerolineales bacterium]